MADDQVVPTPEVTDLNLKSADDLLQRTDDELATAMGLKAPTGGEIDTDNPLDLDEAGVPAAEKKLEPLVPDDPEVKEPVEVATKAEAPKVEEPAKDPAPKPIVDFKVYDKEGELDVPPDLTVSYQANGKARENVPLDKVVRLAQMGEYNSEREEKVLQAKTYTTQVERQNQELQSQVKEYEGWYAKVLADEEFYRRAQDDFARQQSPDARAERAERQLYEERSRHQAENEAQQTAAYVQQNLVPRVTKLIEENPTVSFEEVMGRFNLLVAPMLVRGQLPRHDLPAVQTLIDADLAHWARGRHQSNELDKQRVTNQVAAAQTQSQMAKRQLARATQPAPTSAPGTPAKPKDWKTAEDWLDAALPIQKS